MAHLEIEVKFLLDDPRRWRRRILAAGGRRLSDRVMETNLRFDDRHRSLRSRGALLRLRRDHGIRLTFKRPPAESDPRFKVFEELEVEVGDFDAMQRILEALGFFPQQLYEKWRETFQLDDVQLCLDEMPFGAFLEIEGPGAGIRRAAARLGLDWRHRVLLNYLEIFARLRDSLNLPFGDLTFANFDACGVPPGAIAARLRDILAATQDTTA